MEATKGRGAHLAVGVIAMLVSGIIYAWSVLKTPLAEEFGWTLEKLSLNYTLTLCFFCIGLLLSGLLGKRVSERTRILISGVLVCAGFVLASRLTKDTLWLLYLSYGVLASTGIGLCYSPILSVTNAWFPDKKGLPTGMMMMGFGLSTLIWSNLSDQLIRSSFGWRNTYMMIGIVIGVVLVICSFFFRKPPADAVFPAPKTRKQTAINVELGNYTPMQMIHRTSFWLMLCFFLLHSAAGMTAMGFAKDLALSLDATESFAVTLVGILSIFNGLGRLISGTVYDAFGERTLQLSTTGLAVIGTGLGVIAILMNSLALGALGLGLCAMSYGFSATLAPSITGLFYGQEHFAMNYSVSMLIMIPTSFVATLAGSMVSGSGSFLSAFILLFAMAAVGLVFNYNVRKP